MTPPGSPSKRKNHQPPTREGWWFLGATLLVGAAAIDAGINLYFLTFGMMVCLIAAGIALSELGLAGLRVRRVLPPAIHAGTPYLMGIALENRKRRLPSFSIEVEDLIDGRPDREALLLPQAARGAAAGDGVPQHDGAARALPPVGFPAGDQVSVRARAARAGGRRRRTSSTSIPPSSRRPKRCCAACPLTRRPDDRPRPAGRASSTGCGRSGQATTRATSTGARARAAGYRSCAKKRTRRRARRR